jgi:hypothetical protein
MMKWQYAYALVLLDDGKHVVSAEGEAPDGVDEVVLMKTILI